MLEPFGDGSTSRPGAGCLSVAGDCSVAGRCGLAGGCPSVADGGPLADAGRPACCPAARSEAGDRLSPPCRRPPASVAPTDAANATARSSRHGNGKTEIPTSPATDTAVEKDSTSTTTAAVPGESATASAPANPQSKRSWASFCRKAVCTAPSCYG